MWLHSVNIRNFRTIDNLTIEFDQRTNVIVGPNAVGKTTVLEAIRLAKATLAPRTQNELQSVFIGLGAISPHNPTVLNSAALARDPGRLVEIDLFYKLIPSEIDHLEFLIPLIANSIVRAETGAAGMVQNQIALVQYLSSQNGQQHLTTATKLISSAIPNIKIIGLISLKLRIDPSNGVVNGLNQIDQLIFSAMESRLPTYQALFSYFPADRAMPIGEITIQIGGPDAMAQLESHNSQPQTKYHRLKPTIVNNMILSDVNRAKMNDDFAKIFEKILKDRILEGVHINELGLVSIKIKEISSNRVFDIDGMSSGEKGLILMFLLISQSISKGGLVLIDEPELHLNPAVCKLLLPFLIEEYLVPNDVQAIICSHSPEILSCAFDSPLTRLLQLKSPTVISRIYPEDKTEVFDALRRLGVSTSDVLFAAGSIFVEGDHDKDILEAGFGRLLTKFNMTQLGGRQNIEKEIKTLQDADNINDISTLKCFIFDLDNAPTTLKSSKNVRIVQWKRRCLENYLIDNKIIYDLLSDRDNCPVPLVGRGELQTELFNLAFNQLQDFVSNDVYNKYFYENLGIRPKELVGKQFSEMSNILFGRINTLKKQIESLSEIDWKKEFIEKCEAEVSLRAGDWKPQWITLCDGKRFFSDLHQKYKLKMKPLKFKKMIIERMQHEKSEGWILIQSLLTEGLSS